MSETITDDDLPFMAEYAKSGRASCKGCKGNIAKESLRLAVMVQAPSYDGKMANWFHFACFFGRNRIKTVADIKHFDQLRWEDQEKIKEKMVPMGAGGVQADVAAGDATLNDFNVDSAKSSRSVCRGCEAKIIKGAVRVSKKDYESTNAKRFGPMDRWYHLQCFADKRNELEFFPSGSLIPGFSSLTPEEQGLVKEKMPEVKQKATKRPAEKSDVPAKKPKLELQKEEKSLKEQNKLIFEFRDNLQKQLSKKELILLLEHNDQEIPQGESKILDRLSDCMAFGALTPCPECKEGQLSYGNGGYRCHGNLTEWTKCNYLTKTPKRQAFCVPEDLKSAYPFIAKYKYVARERIFSSVEEKPSVGQNSDQADGPSKIKFPLNDMKFVVVGKTKLSKTDISKAIANLGGEVVGKIDENTTAVISVKEEVDKLSSKIKEAKTANVHVVSEEVIEALKSGKVAAAIKNNTICNWGADLSTKIKTSSSADGNGNASGSGKSVPSLQKLTIKGGSAVDPDSDLEDKAHVLEEKGSIYSVVLGMVDVSRGTNSYYKLQLLECDKHKKYWVFRSWGRIGTTIGGKKLEKMNDKAEAKHHFKSLYEEKTGNCWKDRQNFVKYPNRFYPMDIDYGDDDNIKQLKDIKSKVPSNLAKPIQDLVCMIFDVESMKNALIEYEIDLNKMPLGKLSRRQIESAYGILTELQEMIQGGRSETKFLDGSNRFYTLIPHDFGLKKPPLLNNEEIINAKIEMLDSLMEIEIAYNILKGTEESGKHPIDAHYEKLNATLEVLGNDSDEYKLLSDYAENTHGATHNQYSLEIKEIFKVVRKGESSRYKPFKKLPNRTLLWHGSRVTNYAGILSQGLRIAPPEAPVTGYMFGKGIYFADMVSKSANYCHTTKANPTGLLMLCEVALGNMHELKQAGFVTKLPPGKHSTKGIGMTRPDPAAQHVSKDGVIIPLGKPISDAISSSLLYNEYIVYDVAQVNAKYLMQVDFKWKF